MVKEQTSADKTEEYNLTNVSKVYLLALKKLTPREIEVLEMVGQGYTSREIGKEMYLSYRTIQKYRENICKKLDLNGYRSLFHWCQEYMS